MESDSALKIALFLIFFNLALPLIAALGIWDTVPAGESVPMFGDWDFGSLATTAVGLITFVGALVFQMSVGAAVFSATFAVTGGMFAATLTTVLSPFNVGEAAALVGGVHTIVLVGINAIFLFVFMELSR